MDLRNAFHYPKSHIQIFLGVKTEKSLWPIFSFVFYRISFVYLRCSVGIVNGVGKLCNSVYIIFIYRILTYFIFGVFVQLLCKTGHPNVQRLEDNWPSYRDSSAWPKKVQWLETNPIYIWELACLVLMGSISQCRPCSML